MNLIFSCRWDRSVFDNPAFRLPATASDYEPPYTSPWLRPVTNMPNLDWKHTPLPAALYGGSAGSEPLPVDGSGSPGYAQAQNWNEGTEGLRRVFDPQNGANGVNIALDNANQFDQASNMIPSEGSSLPAGSNVTQSPALLPSYLFIPASGCTARNTCGLGDVMETPDPQELVYLIDRPRPSIIHKTDSPLVLAGSPADRSGDLWCRFANWVNDNPLLAVAALAAIYTFRGKK